MRRIFSDDYLNNLTMKEFRQLPVEIQELVMEESAQQEAEQAAKRAKQMEPDDPAAISEWQTARWMNIIATAIADAYREYEAAEAELPPILSDEERQWFIAAGMEGAWAPEYR